MRRSAILWAIVGGVLILAGCGGSQSTEADSDTAMSSGSSAQGAGANSDAGISSGSNSLGGLAARNESAKGDDIDQVMKDLLSVLNESSNLLAAIKDEQSARAAARRMVELEKRKAEIQADVDRLKRASISREEARRLEATYSLRLQFAVKMVVRENARLQGKRNLWVAYFDEAKKLGMMTGVSEPPPLPPPIEWREFRCPEGGFACKFPGRPSRQSGAPPRFVFEVGDSAYMASYSDLDASIDVSVAERLKVGTESFAEDLNDVEVKDVMLAGVHPGMSVAGVDSDGDLQIVRLYIAEGRLYQMMAVVPPAKKDAPDTVRFLSSLTLLDLLGEALVDLRSLESNHRESAANRLARIVVKEEKRPEVSAALVPLLSDPDVGIRRAALNGLKIWYAPDAIPAVIECAKDSDRRVRGLAIEILGTAPGERAAETVAAHFPEDRGRAAATLREMGPVAQKSVAKYLSNADEGVRHSALDVVEEIGYEQIVPEVLEVLSNGDDSLRRRVLRLLEGCSDQRCVAPVAKWLLSDHDRSEAIRCLKSMGPMVEDTVLLGLKHSNPDVVRACCDILGAVGTVKSIPELRRKRRHRNDVIARAAKDAQQAITARREPLPHK